MTSNLTTHEQWMVRSNLDHIAAGEDPITVIASLRATGYDRIADAVEETTARVTTYLIETERYELNGREGWHCTLTAADGGSLHGADGDNEQESITITVCQYLGNLPADFPTDLIDSATPES